jgi:hypothetical protein
MEIGECKEVIKCNWDIDVREEVCKVVYPQ